MLNNLPSSSKRKATNPYARRAWRHFVAAKIVRYFGDKDKEVNPYERRETRVYRLLKKILYYYYYYLLFFFIVSLSLKDMAPNYSKLAQAFFVHELLLTVIFVLFRRRRNRKHRFWVNNIIKKRLTQGANHKLI